MKEQPYVYYEQTRFKLADLQGLIQKGQKLNAIALVKEATGAPLRAAKDFVEAIERGNYRPYQQQGNASTSSKPKFSHLVINEARLQLAPIYQLLSAGNKIQAIKEVRDQTGLGIRESKELIEKIEANDYEEHMTFGKTTTSQKALKQSKSQQFNAVQSSPNNGRALPILLLLLLAALGFVYFLVV